VEEHLRKLVLDYAALDAGGCESDEQQDLASLEK
jgi:hypothetical protein